MCCRLPAQAPPGDSSAGKCGVQPHLANTAFPTPPPCARYVCRFIHCIGTHFSIRHSDSAQWDYSTTMLQAARTLHRRATAPSQS